MFIISQPCSLELCLYKVKRGNFGITVQKYPHTQQHIIHKAPRLYITKMAQFENLGELVKNTIFVA